MTQFGVPTQACSPPLLTKSDIALWGWNTYMASGSCVMPRSRAKRQRSTQKRVLCSKLCQSGICVLSGPTLTLFSIQKKCSNYMSQQMSSPLSSLLRTNLAVLLQKTVSSGSTGIQRQCSMPPALRPTFGLRSTTTVYTTTISCLPKSKKMVLTYVGWRHCAPNQPMSMTLNCSILLDALSQL